MSYTRTGPYFQVCNICGQKIGWGSLARGGHEKGARHQLALKPFPENIEGVKEIERQMEEDEP